MMPMISDFGEIVNLDHHSVQRILKEVDGNVFAVALKNAHDDLLAQMYKNMSSRAAALLKEDIELGPTRIPEVMDAQRQIVEVIRMLEASGQIRLPRGR